jgi:hypothetical protein
MNIIKTTLRFSLYAVSTLVVGVGSAYAVVAHVQWII